MRKFVAGLAFLTLVLLLLGLLGRPAYRRYREHHALARAKEFLVKGEYRNASLSARQVLQVNPRNLEACRILARLAEMARAPEALEWVARIAELSPGIETRLALAAAALRLEPPPFPRAARALEELEPVATNLVAFHVLSAELALKSKRAAEAESHFEVALRLEPTNALHQMNLAVLRLVATNPVTAAQARLTLERLSTNNASLAPGILRWLVTDGMQRKDLAAARRFSGELLLEARSDFSDRLQHLEILHQSDETEFQRSLSSLQTAVSTNAPQIYDLSSWLIRHELHESALQWITNLSQSTQQLQPVRLTRADCYLARKDWRSLQDFLQEQQWGDLEYLRFAMLSRAAFERKDEPSAGASWRLAVHAAGNQLRPLRALLAMADSCGRSDGREDLLWKILRQYPREARVAHDLNELYSASGNTRGLNRLYAFLVSSDPTNLFTRNNLAATSLLLKLNLPDAHQLAKDLFRTRTKDPVIASTYAYSLYLQGNTAQGLAVLEPFRAQIVENKTLALYYGLLLAQQKPGARAESSTNSTRDEPASQGESDQATATATTSPSPDSPYFYLTLARDARLLPEERELLETALKQL